MKDDMEMWKYDNEYMNKWRGKTFKDISDEMALILEAFVRYYNDESWALGGEIQFKERKNGNIENLPLRHKQFLFDEFGEKLTVFQNSFKNYLNWSKNMEENNEKR